MTVYEIPEDYSNILEKLAQVIDPEQSTGKSTSTAQPEPQSTAESLDNSGKEFSDADFDALLDALNSGSLPDSDSSGAAEKKTVDLKKILLRNTSSQTTTLRLFLTP